MTDNLLKFYDLKDEEETKKCSKCHMVKPISAFRIDSSRNWRLYQVDRKYRRDECIDCGNLIKRQRTKARRNAPPKPKCCELCGDETVLFLDHCHVTGLFRGWLCSRCNLGLGKFGDDMKKIKMAVVYMERFYARHIQRDSTVNSTD